MYQTAIFNAEKRRKINIFVWNTQILDTKNVRLLKYANTIIKKHTYSHTRKVAFEVKIKNYNLSKVERKTP